MSIDGRFVGHLADELNQELNNGRIQKISQLGKTDFLFIIRANNKNQKLYLSLSTSLARINLTDNNYSKDFTPGGFCMFLRKFFERGVVKNIKALNFDRIIQIEVESTNDIGDRVKLYLVLETFSRYTNLIILDDSFRVLNAYKHISPFDNSERTIINGVKYELPVDNKLTPFDYDNIKLLFNSEVTYKDLINKIRGISPLLAKYIVNKAEHNYHRMFDVYYETINRKVTPTLAIGNKTEFYYIDLFSKGQTSYSSLSKLIDVYFLEASSLERVKQVHKYINNSTKQELKRKKHKLEKLSVDLDKALNSNILRIKGDVLITNQHNIYKGDALYKGVSYELDQEIEVELDRLLSPIQNANKYYNKYKKQKKAVAYIKKQIKITKVQIIYFEEVYNQINSTFSLSDLLEIQDELRANGFLSKKKISTKKHKPNYDVYYDDLGIMILVGKNNLQNNFLTHKYAKKDHWWFHTKGQSGSHVVVASFEDLEELTIRTAANLSACFSKSRLSQSVPIDYTKVRNIKKVPGMLGSFVTYTNQKTIYIDPNMDEVNKLKRGR